MTTEIADWNADRYWLRGIAIVVGITGIIDLLAIAVQWSVP